MAKDKVEPKDRKPRVLNAMTAARMATARAKKSMDAAQRAVTEHAEQGQTLQGELDAATLAYNEKSEEYATLLRQELAETGVRPEGVADWLLSNDKKI